jgi:hypothetical protein
MVEDRCGTFGDPRGGCREALRCAEAEKGRGAIAVKRKLGLRRRWRFCLPAALLGTLVFVLPFAADAQAPDAGPDSDVRLVPQTGVLYPGLREAGEGEPLPWWAGELSLAMGGDYSSGDYGLPKDTDMLYVPFTAAYLFEELALTPWGGDQLELQITLAYLRIRGEGTVLPGGDVRGGSALPRQTEDGFGDIYLLANYIWLPSWEHVPLVEFGVLVKAPTASTSKRIGTGKTDVSLELALSDRFGDWSPYVEAGYRFMGSTSQFDLHNRWLTSIGVTYTLSDRWSFGVAYDYRQAASNRSYASHELVPYASIRLDKGFRLGPYVAIGLSRGSPDYAVGLQLRWAKFFE